MQVFLEGVYAGPPQNGSVKRLPRLRLVQSFKTKIPKIPLFVVKLSSSWPSVFFILKTTNMATTFSKSNFFRVFSLYYTL